MKTISLAIVSGLLFEILQIAVFMVFPVGPCNAPLPGVVVCYLHTPSFWVLNLLGVSWPGELLLAPLIQTPVWIVLCYAILGAVHHVRRRRRDSLPECACPNCSYDLRASRVQCPECGTPIPESQNERQNTLIDRT